jgi:hypothetical protein
MSATCIWTVHFRIDSKSKQQELVRYTEEAAVHFAQGIIDSGGVAVVVEGLDDEEETNDDFISIPLVHPKPELIWPSDKEKD